MDHSTESLKSTPFRPDDLVRGDDGELYHLPTLRALHASGRLLPESTGFWLLLRLSERNRLTA